MRRKDYRSGQIIRTDFDEFDLVPRTLRDSYTWYIRNAEDTDFSAVEDERIIKWEGDSLTGHIAAGPKITSVPSYPSAPSADKVLDEVGLELLLADIRTNLADVDNRIHEAVQDVAALKAIDTTDAGLYPDKMVINVEDKGIYRLDRNSSATANDDTVVAPTAGTGRWFRMVSALVVKNNFTAGAYPDVGNDSTQGYSVGSLWYYNSKSLLYICDDASSGAAVWRILEVKNNFVATSDPGVDNDIDEGYAVGSRWVNTEKNVVFTCLNNADGAAVWVTAETKHKFNATANPTADNDIDEGYTAGSVWINVTTKAVFTCIDNTDGAAVWAEGSGAGISRVITQATHGFTLGKMLTLNTNTFVLASVDTPPSQVFMVTEVIDPNTFKVTQFGYVEGLSGLSTGLNYLSTSGNLTTSEPKLAFPIFYANTSSSGWLLPLGGSADARLDALENAEIPAAYVSGTDQDLNSPDDDNDSQASYVPIGSSSGTYGTQLKVGTYLWTWQTAPDDSTHVWVGQSAGSSYGSIIFTETAAWNAFAPSSINGLLTFSFDSGEGSFEYYYDYEAWFLAFNGSSDDVVIAKNGDVFKGSIAPENLVVDHHGVAGPQGRVKEKADIGLGDVLNIKHNIAASTDPGAGEDNLDGYSVGSVWINTTKDSVFRCVDSSTAAALWLGRRKETSDPAVGDDVDDGIAVGTFWTNTSSGKVWVCTDNSSGAAVWTDITQTGGGGATAAGDGTITAGNTEATVTFSGEAGNYNRAVVNGVGNNSAQRAFRIKDGSPYDDSGDLKVDVFIDSIFTEDLDFHVILGDE